MEFVIEVVPDRECPGCQRPLKVQKVHDGDHWWDKCGWEDCWVAFVQWESRQIDAVHGKRPPANFDGVILHA